MCPVTLPDLEEISNPTSPKSPCKPMTIGLIVEIDGNFYRRENQHHRRKWQAS